VTELTLTRAQGKAQESIDEDEVTKAHDKVYNQGSTSGLSANLLGSAAALQVQITLRRPCEPFSHCLVGPEAIYSWIKLVIIHYWWKPEPAHQSRDGRGNQVV